MDAKTYAIFKKLSSGSIPQNKIDEIADTIGINTPSNLGAILDNLDETIATSNATTGESDTTLTDAVQRLVDGFGGGGGTGNLKIVAKDIVTIADSAAGGKPISDQFVEAIYNDFVSSGQLPMYMYAILYCGANAQDDCFVASCEQFMIGTGASPSTVPVVYLSNYHKLFKKTSGVLSQEEKASSGVVIGNNLGKTGGTISATSGWLIGAGVTALAGTYYIQVFRLGA